jgi:hypothetical protein
MPLPDFLAKPLFEVVYRLNRYQAGARTPPLKRKVTPLDEYRQKSFDVLLDGAIGLRPNTLISYNLPYPKAEFLNYACDWRGLVAHGSPLNDLEVIEPLRKSKDTNEFGNRQQVFCSPDAIWAMWFAILDKSKYHLTQNGCVRVGQGERRLKYYHFELPAANEADPPFTNGTIYLCRAEAFPEKRPYPQLEWFKAEIEEWGSAQPVIPLARIHVTPHDFPYLKQVQFRL